MTESVDVLIIAPDLPGYAHPGDAGADLVSAEHVVLEPGERALVGTGVSIAGLNCNGNPLHPNPAIGPQHAEDLRRAIRAAGLLGQTRVVTMSGLPGGEPGATVPNWVVNAWNSGALDVLD